MAMRCFIAIEVPEDLQEALGRVQKKLQRAAADVKWAAPRTDRKSTRLNSSH